MRSIDSSYTRVDNLSLLKDKSANSGYGWKIRGERG
jgi:hypothetical protein